MVCHGKVASETQQKLIIKMSHVVSIVILSYSNVLANYRLVRSKALKRYIDQNSIWYSVENLSYQRIVGSNFIKELVANYYIKD